MLQSSGLGAQDEAIESEPESAQEEQRQEVLSYEGHDFHRELQRGAVSGSKIITDGGEQHIKKAASNLRATVGASRAGHLHLGDSFAAKWAAVQMRGHDFAAKCARSRFGRLSWRRAHERIKDCLGRLAQRVEESNPC